MSLLVAVQMCTAVSLVQLSLLCLHLGLHVQQHWTGGSKSTPTAICAITGAPDTVLDATKDPAVDEAAFMAP